MKQLVPSFTQWVWAKLFCFLKFDIDHFASVIDCNSFEHYGDNLLNKTRINYFTD